MAQRSVFNTKFAAIATTVGSAVGLGNIWRFPYEAGMHGGGAFLICYIFFVLIIGVPLLCSEFAMGRATRSNVFGAYSKLDPRHKWHLTGYIGIAASLMILSFYSVVAGWTVEYSVYSLFGELDFSNPNSGHGQFTVLTTGWHTVVWTLIFLIINFLILRRGVTKGIEKVSNILMPVLFVLLIAFCINATTMSNFGKGMEFLFSPDFSKITPSVLLSAMGQAFFSLSLGLGCMMTYASYFHKDTRLGRTALTTAGLDTLVAILSGIIIFPAVFSYGMSPEAGPTLVFEVLPAIFTSLPGGQIWSTLFFILLFIASLTSTVSMSEISITYFCEEKKMSRIRATTISSAIAVAGGLVCALSFGPLSDYTLSVHTIFDLFDYCSSNILLPVGGFICSVFVGYFLDRSFLEKQLTGNGTKGRMVAAILSFLLRYVCPSAIILIFLNSIGLI